MGMVSQIRIRSPTSDRMTPGAPIDIVSCHAEGEVGDVIVSGVDPPPGDTLWEPVSYTHLRAHET